jgi:NAD(P)H-dependent flavin oxidoreductase YrpB (nitropropane dioxygenase family)
LTKTTVLPFKLCTVVEAAGGHNVAVKSSDRAADLRFPIMAPMGIITTPALAAAVSNAGGLGGIGMWGLTAEEAARHIAGFRQLSPRSLNVNYPLWPEPSFTTKASEEMRRHLQRHYDAKGLGSVPLPQGAVSDVSHCPR